MSEKKKEINHDIHPEKTHLEVKHLTSSLLLIRVLVSRSRGRIRSPTRRYVRFAFGRGSLWGVELLVFLATGDRAPRDEISVEARGAMSSRAEPSGAGWSESERFSGGYFQPRAERTAPLCVVLERNRDSDVEVTWINCQ